ncbi:D-alanine--D-alanine ligase [Salipaludibacillus keqinensis]|uniref:D-alanine--D-alanine ligase n=1 Tax=Salipaludibacillus keqinensis TaxID=2045207 RepID=A0A323TWC8_9BACI|nr:D-alanine--D-alanine ligase family protein [Salipaludibacillus keqinensis]PYZ93855.1 D-alanine--D-alanine ligase [Salipaludibacillus keqinensis]
MRTRVAVIFGGVSVEHEVSVISALQAIQNMNQDKYEIIPLYISKDRVWFTGEEMLDIENYKDLKGLLSKAQKVVMARTEDGKVVVQKEPRPRFGKSILSEVDVAFPIIHGTFGEDGVLQGFLELLNVPYVGCDVLSSSTGMDKVIMKNIYRDSDLPVLDYVWFYSTQWTEDPEAWTTKIKEKLDYPVIVKPANLGSSVGISKAENEEELEEAVDLASKFALKIVVEKMVQNMTEVNCSVLGDYEHVEASVCEQVLGSDEFLSYEDKYAGGSKDGGASKGMESTNRVIPAEIGDGKTKEVQEIAKKSFQMLGCSGVSRIDFIIDNDADKVYINEINTIPGSLSFYLWEPAGKPYKQMLDELIQLALKRERDRGRLMFSIDSNLFSLQTGGSKGSKGSKR